MFDPYESEESEESSVDRRGGEIYSGVDQHFDPPPLRLPQKERTGFKYLNSLLLGWSPGPIFKPSGKTRTLGGGPDGVLPSSSELMPLPCPPLLSLAEIAAESRRRPDQDLIDRVDGVSSSAFWYLHTRLTWIPDAGQHCMWPRSAQAAQHPVQDV